MEFRRLYLNPEHYYSVGVDDDTGQYVIEVVITWVAWYSIYFRLTDAEVAAFGDDQDALTELSHELAADKGELRYRDRLILNTGPHGGGQQQ